MGVELLNVDCMEYMATLPDKAFDLAIVDPPYGVGDKFKGGKSGKMQFNEIPNKGWDVAPDPFYFYELFRVTKNQIIWGGNYYDLPPTRCFLVWDKLISSDFSLSMAELGWTSFDALAKIYRLSTPKDGGKIHPTQKPVKLYKWLPTNYAKPGQRILDTHLGSGSSAIAAHHFGFDFVGCELDKDYYDAAVCRFNKATAQISMF
jgi:site-specific DNA-methyltransferase (adenine-specific)